MGMTPLLLAIKLRKYEYVRMLIESDIVQTTDKVGQLNAFEEALIMKDKELVKIMIEH